MSEEGVTLYTHTHTHTHMQRGREREGERERAQRSLRCFVLLDMPLAATPAAAAAAAAPAAAEPKLKCRGEGMKARSHAITQSHVAAAGLQVLGSIHVRVGQLQQGFPQCRSHRARRA